MLRYDSVVADEKLWPAVVVEVGEHGSAGACVAGGG